jgi:anti-anti-sigma regulatory factor
MAVLLVTSNKSKQLLHLSFIGTVRPEDFQNRREDLAGQLAGLSPGFRSLVDLTHLEFMGLDCTRELGRQMELVGKSGVGLVVRVLPDPSKDIGMNILTVFHYPKHLQVVTCRSVTEAVKVLGL